MAMSESDSFDASQCLALFRRSRLGRISVVIQALPVVFPVAYLVDDKGFLIGVSLDEMAQAMTGGVLALQADGWSEDAGRRWTVLAIGHVTPVEFDDESSRLAARDPTATPWDERYVYRLRPEILRGRWMDEG